MMRLLREKTKIIMIVVAAAFLIGFIFFQLGVGGGGKLKPTARSVGGVNGREISYDEFQKAQNAIVQQMDEQGREDLTEEDYGWIEEQAWNQLVYQVLLRQEIERRGIRVTDEEVREFLTNNPPEFIRTHESFKVNGQFSQERYLEFLNAPEYRDLVTSLEGSIRENLPRILLVNQIAMGIDFSDDELLQEYRDRKEEVRVGYVFLDEGSMDGEGDARKTGGSGELLPAREDPYAPTDEEIESYYRGHRDDFKESEKVSLQYLTLSTSPTRKDTAAARDRAEEVADRLRKGEDFATLAQEFSADRSTAAKGGDLGFLGKGEMLSPIESVAFSMKEGEISDPIRTPLGWHVVKVEGRRGTKSGGEVHLRHILIPIQMGLSTRDSLYALVRDFFEDMKEGGKDFTQAAEDRRIPLKTTAPFARKDSVKELGPIMQEAAEFAFSQDVGAVSQSITRQGTIFILRVGQKTPERTLTLDEARGEIARLLSTEKKFAALKERAESLLQDARARGGLKAAAGAAGLDYRETPFFTRKAFVPGIGRQNAFIGYAHALPVASVGGPAKTENGYYVLQVLERKGIDTQEFEKAKAGLREEMINRAKTEAFDRWLSATREEADIVDNRLLFGLSS